MQGDLGTLVASETSGTALAELLRVHRDALHTNHSGESRPSYVQTGMTWLDTSDSAAWKMKLYTGTIDIVVGTYNPTSGATSTYTKAEADARYPRLDGANAGPLAGLRNLIINGDFRVNQRGAASKSQAVGVYGFDRWKGHADGIEQVIEGANVGGGSHTLSWSGGGQGRLAGGALAVSPITVSLTAGANVSVVVPSTATNVQLEPGAVVTSFERRPIGLELLLCQRYFEVLDGTIFSPSPLATGGPNKYSYWHFKVTKRASPSLLGTGVAYGGIEATPGRVGVRSNLADEPVIAGGATASAEL